MYKIFIIEDDLTIAKTIKNQLLAWDYEAEYVTDFKDILNAFTNYKPHLVLMDISLPFYNGYYWCQQIRGLSKIPILFLSSASDNMNLVMAINMGGDDFLSKPFDFDVLIAKIQALLRRSYDFSTPAGQMEYRGAILDTGAAKLLYQNTSIPLTKNEFCILQVLLENKGRTVSRDTLMEKLWETDSFIDDNTLTVNVTRLRKKLTNAGLSDFIITKKGVGYLVENDREELS